MIQPGASIYDTLSALADPLRCRVLLLLERRELAVAEVVQAMQLPQSTISRHLKALADEGLVASREEGASNLYTARVDGPSQPLRRLWGIVRDQTAGLAAAEEDARRLESVLASRRSRSQAYFSSAAGQWDRIRGELFGANSHLHALLALLGSDWTVGDLGCGSGHITQALAPHVKQVVAVDESAAMLAAARKRLAEHANVELRKGDVSQLPIEDGELDAAVLNLVLAYVNDPGEVLMEASRVLKPDGKLLVVDMHSHDRDDIMREMGHVWPGFTASQLQDWGRAAKLKFLAFRDVPADPAARGPSLFVASLRRSQSRESVRSRKTRD